MVNVCKEKKINAVVTEPNKMISKLLAVSNNDKTVIIFTRN